MPRSIHPGAHMHARPYSCALAIHGLAARCSDAPMMLQGCNGSARPVQHTHFCSRRLPAAYLRGRYVNVLFAEVSRSFSGCPHVIMMRDEKLAALVQALGKEQLLDATGNTVRRKQEAAAQRKAAEAKAAAVRAAASKTKLTPVPNWLLDLSCSSTSAGVAVGRTHRPGGRTRCGYTLCCCSKAAGS